MESSDVFSYIGALGAIATVIALIPEKNRMAAFSFLKKILRQVLNFFRKAIKIRFTSRMAYSSAVQAMSEWSRPQNFRQSFSYPPIVIWVLPMLTVKIMGGWPPCLYNVII